MKRLFSLPFLVDRYLADTENLTVEEHGAYCLVLFAMWKEGGKIPDDDDWIARKLRVSVGKWRSLRKAVGPYLEAYGPEGERYLTQKRLQKQWNHAVESSERQKAKGSLGGKAKQEHAQAERLRQVTLAPATNPASKIVAVARKNHGEIVAPATVPASFAEDNSKVPSTSPVLSGCTDRSKIGDNPLKTIEQGLATATFAGHVQPGKTLAGNVAYLREEIITNPSTTTAREEAYETKQLTYEADPMEYGRAPKPNKLIEAALAKRRSRA